MNSSSTALLLGLSLYCLALLYLQYMTGFSYVCLSLLCVYVCVMFPAGSCLRHVTKSGSVSQGMWDEHGAPHKVSSRVHFNLPLKLIPELIYWLLDSLTHTITESIEATVPAVSCGHHCLQCANFEDVHKQQPITNAAAAIKQQNINSYVIYFSVCHT